MLAPEKLRILAFPQRIVGDQLDVNVLLLPTQRTLNNQTSFESQLNPGTFLDLPRFINAELSLEAKVIRGLSTYPFSLNTSLTAEGVSVETIVTDAAFPPNLPAVYEGLAAQFQFDNSVLATQAGAPAVKADKDGIRKYLPESYRTAFNFTNPRTEFAKIDDSYHCAIKKAPDIDPLFETSPPEVTWGRVIAFCLRQPLLAERIGLVHRLTLTLPTDTYFENGGWIYFNLNPIHAEFDITSVGTELKLYAARIPDITGPRQLFAALLYPVLPGPIPPQGSFDLLKIETADYDDGFAKIVHAFQPVSANLLSETPDGIHVQKETGIRLGWDDEQLLIWHNRQILADPATPGARIDAPLGVFSYRVDVREKTTPESDWNSLVALRNIADLTLGGELVAPANTQIETGVQVYPVQINADPGTFYWLPSYFTQWYGVSLACPDSRAAQLDASGALANPGTYSDSKISQKNQTGGLYEPIPPANLELKYGTQYEFRVRLADLTGGGPLVGDDELNDAPAKSAFIRFRRYVAPKQLKVTPLEPQANPNARTNVFLTGNSFEISRPRLGYPALLFTEMDTATAFNELLDDKTFLHTGKAANETIKDQREVSYFDPDVDRMLVIVELKTLQLDNLASLNQREAFIPLYQTFRDFPANPEEPFTLELEYRDANVIDFGNNIDLGDLSISENEIDDLPQIVLPRSRDIRITLLPVCSDKDDKPAYFGFGLTRFGERLVRTGEPTQFFVRENATDEQNFFRLDLESRQLQGLYLQPDPPQVNNKLTFIKEIVEGVELAHSTLMQRLAERLNVDYKGMSLIGNPGERIQFGCSNRIRHTLAPDNSSITFATRDDLINHWLCALSFEINRDWTWDGLSDEGIEIRRTKQFTGENNTVEANVVVGSVQVKKTASRVATVNPDRSLTRVVFIDAVEPKKDLNKPSTAAQPFPNTIDVSYTLTPKFIDSVPTAVDAEQEQTRDLVLPVTTKPAQVPKIVAAGYALSPYQADTDYSETAVRQRYLWLEFEAPIADPNDTYFARVLNYAPDPLLALPNVDQLFVKPFDPPLGIDPELIRVITNDQNNDNAGIDAMQMMIAETPDPAVPMVQLSPIHYLLPLPPGLHNESNELFGFYTYEVRVGHSDRIWCTAQGRFGHPIRVNGVQHPAPPLQCLVDRTPKGIKVTAHYAQALFSGKDITSKPPKTEIWCMLYAQVRQADDRKNRNILLSELKLEYDAPKQQFFGAKFFPINMLATNLDAPSTGIQEWSQAEIEALLNQYNLDHMTGLSVLAVEMMPRYDQYIIQGPPVDTSVRPLSRDLGRYRILRTSRLVAAPEIC